MVPWQGFAVFVPISGLAGPEAASPVTNEVLSFANGRDEIGVAGPSISHPN